MIDDDRNNLIIEAAHRRMDSVESMLRRFTNNPAPTVPQYDLSFASSPPPPAHGLLRADHWHLTTYVDGQLIIDAPDAYFFSQPDNGFVWPSNWLVDSTTAGYSFFPVWGATPVDTVWGPTFSGGSFWFPWWKNIYWPDASSLLNNMQGSNILPFTDFSGSHSIQNYTPGTGKAMRGGSFSNGTATLFGNTSYQRSGVGTMWTALYDVSTKNMGQGNATVNGMGFVSPSQGWTPWSGAFTQNYPFYQGLILPLQDGADHNVWSWNMFGGLLQIDGGPGGDHTTGPGFATTMSVTDVAFHTIKWEVTYNGHDYVDLPPGVSNPYVGS